MYQKVDIGPSFFFAKLVDDEWFSENKQLEQTLVMSSFSQALENHIEKGIKCKAPHLGRVLGRTLHQTKLISLKGWAMLVGPFSCFFAKP